MVYLYLFKIDSLISCKPMRNYAILSSNRQEKLETLSEGDNTGIFNDFGLQYDIVSYKSVHTFSNDLWNKILGILKNNPNSKMSIITGSKRIILKIDTEILTLNDFSELENTEYKYVGVYL